MIPKKIVLNVSSDSTSWQIILAKSLPFLLSQLASYSVEYASEESQIHLLSLSERKLLISSWSQSCQLSYQFHQVEVKGTSDGR
jgi:hypothetical protein